MTEKFGVYVPTHNNPVFLRLTLLQILAQSRRPDVVAIYENGHGDSYHWAVDDVVELLMQNGVQVLRGHTPNKVEQPAFFLVPLEILVKAGCTIFAMLGHDDIIYSDHFRTLLGYLGHLDWASNIHSQLLVLPRTGKYLYNPKVDFGTWNPTGAHPATIIFRLKVAEEYVELLKRRVGTPDDVVLAELLRNTDLRKPGVGYGFLDPIRGCSIETLAPTICYVSHGKNTSTAHWADQPPLEVL